MRILILGGDKRYNEIIKYFINRKDNIDIVNLNYNEANQYVKVKNIENVTASDYNIIIFPINGVLNDYIISGENKVNIPKNFLDSAKDNTLIFSGISTKCLNEMSSKSNKEIIYFMKDKNVILDNAIPTVEGIISNIINNTDITINNANIMVIGYGNIGKRLVDTLIYMGANTSVSIIDNEDKKALDNLKIKNIYSNNINDMIGLISISDIIINTAPSKVIDKRYIQYINLNTYILDVASYPHGIDKDLLDKNNIKNKIYLGIPSIVAPKTSGYILSKKIDKTIKGR